MTSAGAPLWPDTGSDAVATRAIVLAAPRDARTRLRISNLPSPPLILPLLIALDRCAACASTYWGGGCCCGSAASASSIRLRVAVLNRAARADNTAPEVLLERAILGSLGAKRLHQREVALMAVV